MTVTPITSENRTRGRFCCDGLCSAPGRNCPKYFRDSPDPGVNQGRNEHHDPKVNRDAIKTVVLLLAPIFIVVLIVWGVRTWIGGAA